MPCTLVVLINANAHECPGDRRPEPGLPLHPYPAVEEFVGSGCPDVEGASASIGLALDEVRDSVLGDVDGPERALDVELPGPPVQAGGVHAEGPIGRLAEQPAPVVGIAILRVHRGLRGGLDAPAGHAPRAGRRQTASPPQKRADRVRGCAMAAEGAEGGVVKWRRTAMPTHQPRSPGLDIPLHILGWELQYY